MPKIALKLRRLWKCPKPEIKFAEVASGITHYLPMHPQVNMI
jgi:hypothetical protein